MNQLDRDIQHLEASLKKWSSLYDKEDLARVNRLLAYMKEIKKLKGGTK